ncbi:MAG: TlyA family RNA methyltransferase [Clostridia bacterium]|nr:TlyA family RNA methyltransferase [Clostridia bacterium]
MAKKAPLVQRLLKEGYFASKEEALPWVMGGQVLVGTLKASTLSQSVSLDAPITVKGLESPYFSKGGLKLEGAIRDFGIQVEGRVCIDAGASTGGFTHCLVKNGAERVYAVDVGYGQLNGALRQNPHVVNLEKTNISDEKLLKLDPKPTLASVDLSYLSLRKGVPAFMRVMDPHGELMCLVKPLFEVDDPQARRTGQLADDAYLPTLLALIDDLNSLEGATVLKVTHSPVTGNNGTREFFLHVALGCNQTPPNLQNECQAAIDRALVLEAYKK